MFKIEYFGYDLYNLGYDYAPTNRVLTNRPGDLNGKTYKSIGAALIAVCRFLGTQYHKCDWLYEEEVCELGDAWVLHIIVDSKYRFANDKMLKRFNYGSLDLYDLLVNVKITPIKAK